MKDFLTVPKHNSQTHILLVYGTVQNAFYLDMEQFLNRKKAFRNNIERQRMVHLDSERFFSLTNTFTKLRNAFFKEKTSFCIYLNAFSTVFFINIFRWEGRFVSKQQYQNKFCNTLTFIEIQKLSWIAFCLFFCFGDIGRCDPLFRQHNICGKQICVTARLALSKYEVTENYWSTSDSTCNWLSFSATNTSGKMIIHLS
jgi:hypothetical protein